MTAGFIVGFDSEQGSVADAIVELIEEAAIPVCMVGLLYAVPNTQLTRRLAKEGRLHSGLSPRKPAGGMDQCTQGLNFDTLRPRNEILSDYKRVLEKVYDPVAYAGRLQRLERLLGKSAPNRQVQSQPPMPRAGSAGWRLFIAIVSSVPGAQDVFKRTIIQSGIDESATGSDHRSAGGFLSPPRSVFAARHSSNRSSA